MNPFACPDSRCATLPVRARAFLFALLFALAAPAFAAGSVTLAWDAVNSASVRGYMIHYGPSAGSYNASVDVGNITTANVINLTEGATYHFAVAAYDASHTEGGLSNDVATIVPYKPPVASFSASATSGTAPLAINFTNGSTGSITSYAWTFGDGTTSAVASPVKVYSTAGTYTVALTVTGPAGSNTSTRSNYITVTNGTGSDTTPPSAPGAVTATAAGSGAINLSWTAATDNVGVTGYKVERCTGAGCATFAQIATPTGTSYANSGLAAGTTYRYRIRATDAAGNLGAYSAVATATTSAGTDTTAPSTPGSFSAVATASTSVRLTWTAATDNVGVTGYKVERCTGASCATFTQVGAPTGTVYSDSVNPGTTYRYRVRATDAAGNLGPYTAIASVTTPAASGTDTTAPSAPGSLSAVPTAATAVRLTWTAATDNVKVTGYKVQRCTGASCTAFVQVGAPTGTAYSDSVMPSTTYRYRVRATDAAGNLGPYTAIVSVTTPSS